MIWVEKQHDLFYMQFACCSFRNSKFDPYSFLSTWDRTPEPYTVLGDLPFRPLSSQGLVASLPKKLDKASPRPLNFKKP